MSIKHFTKKSDALHFIKGIEIYLRLNCTLISVKTNDKFFVEIANIDETQIQLINFFYLGFIHNQSGE